MTPSETCSVPHHYRSPQRKLLRFFENSRNQWKAKCRTAKALVRQVKNRATWLEQSRDSWKVRACRLTAQVRELRREVARQQREIESLKKNRRPPHRRTRN
jgi:DNA repair ATPase RecN